jgi:uncharacterized protein (DUF305 family)
MAIFSRAFVRRRIISLAASLSVSATSFALAQDPAEVRHLRTPVNDWGERQFLFAKDVAVSDMAQASLTRPSGDVDRDFVGMMAARDQATMELARAELLYGHNDQIRRLAQDIVAQQQHLMSEMKRAIGNTSVDAPASARSAAASIAPSSPGANRQH